MSMLGDLALYEYREEAERNVAPRLFEMVRRRPPSGEVRLHADHVNDALWLHDGTNAAHVAHEVWAAEVKAEAHRLAKQKSPLLGGPMRVEESRARVAQNPHGGTPKELAADAQRALDERDRDTARDRITEIWDRGSK